LIRIVSSALEQAERAAFLESVAAMRSCGKKIPLALTLDSLERARQ
jgi:hypothetical protein